MKGFAIHKCFFQHPNALLPQSKTRHRKTLYLFKYPQKLNQFKYMSAIWAHTDVSWWITPCPRFDVTDQTHSPITGICLKPWQSHGNTYPLYPGTIAQHFTQELSCKAVSVSAKEIEKSRDTEKNFLLCWHPTLCRKTKLFNFGLTWASLRPLLFPAGEFVQAASTPKTWLLLWTLALRCSGSSCGPRRQQMCCAHLCICSGTLGWPGVLCQWL